MKKSSLMGASVVAAALLAAAPVVAPVASLATPGTQVVKADTDYTGEVASKVKSMSTATTLKNESDLNTFLTALENVPSLQAYKSRTDFVSSTTSTVGSVTAPIYINTDDKAIKVNGNGAALLPYFFSGQSQVNLETAAHVAAAQKMSYDISFYYSNAINTHAFPITSVTDITRLKSDIAKNGGTVTMSLQLYDGSSKSLGDAGLLKSTVSYNVNNARAAYVNYADTLNAHVGDSAELYGLTNSFMNGNGQIRDYNGNDITMAAYNNGAISVTPLGSKNAHPGGADQGIVDGNFKKAGQYYQKFIIDLTKVLGVPSETWSADDWKDAVNGGLISVNGQTPSLTNSDANIFLAAESTTVDGSAIPKGSLVLKRTVNVDADQGAFKSEKVSGIVTVNMNNGMAAQVYDENGKMVLGRALPNKSAWKTGEKRTYYKDGQVFYQVSTNEYVRAQDVTFSEPFQDSVVRGDVTITKYPDQVIATKNDDHYSIVYALDADGNGFHMTSRALAGNTKWRNGAKAVVNGKTFYQISTNEWLNSGSLAD